MRTNLVNQVLIAVAVGILVGLFLGPLALAFKPMASIYVMFLQMVLLPYIAISIIHGMGSITFKDARRLFKNIFFSWLFLWGLLFLIVFLMSLMIPKPLTAGISFQENVPALKTDLTKNILSLIVPENPLGDFVNNIVPAIAVFGIIVGFALMFIEKKEPLMSLLERGNEVIEKIFHWLVLVAPIGVFAHVAVIAGTINFTELHRYHFYIVSFILISLIIVLWILPSILSALIPMSFTEAIKAIVEISLVTFFTGITIIAIPLILILMRKKFTGSLGIPKPSEKSALGLGQSPYNRRSQIGSYYINTDQFAKPAVVDSNELSLKPKNRFFRWFGYIETVVPISYTFVQIGNALFLFFILYASFYFRYPLTISEKSLLGVLSIPISIGSSSLSLTGVSSLFQEMNFSDNVQQLFSEMGPLIMNFQATVNIAGVLTCTLLILYSNHQMLQIKWKKLLFNGIGSIALLTIIIFVISPHLHLKDYYTDFYLNRKISEAIDDPVKAKTYLPGEEIPQLSSPSEGVLERVLRTNVLRVGYENTNNIPFYYKQNNEPVGFDIAMAYQLAQDLNCQLEFIPLDHDRLGEELREGRYDIAMSAILMTEDRLLEMNFSDTYTDQNFTLIVPIKNKDKFANFAALQNQKGLILGASGGYKRVMVNFPNATRKEGNWEIEFERGEIDASISSHTISIAWCLSHPDFIVKEYGGRLGKCYFAYPVKQDAYAFLRFINNWIQLKIQDKFYQKQYDYWILGKPSKNIPPKPRWSVIRNVLHWVD